MANNNPGLPNRDAFSTYGGALTNYAPVEDPTTDEDADWRNLYVMNVAAMTATVPLAMRSFLGSAGGDPTSSFVHDSVWGNSNGVKPTVTNAGTGVWDVSWPATVTDALGQLHDLNFRRAEAHVDSAASTLFQSRATVTGPHSVRVFTFSGGALSNLSTGEIVTVKVW